MAEEIKGISLGNWITIISIVLGFGANYGVMQSNLKAIERQLEKESTKQEAIFDKLTQHQRIIDAHATEFVHLRELRELENKAKNE